MKSVIFCKILTPTTEILLEQISYEKILNAIRSLKNNKSCGVDDILNEYFQKAADILIEPLYILFNKILDSGSFPAQ